MKMHHGISTIWIRMLLIIAVVSSGPSTEAGTDHILSSLTGSSTSCSVTATATGNSQDDVEFYWYMYDNIGQVMHSETTDQAPVGTLIDTKPCPSADSTTIVVSEGNRFGYTTPPLTVQCRMIRTNPKLQVLSVTLDKEDDNQWRLSYSVKSKHAAADVHIMYHGFYVDGAGSRKLISPVVTPKPIPIAADGTHTLANEKINVPGWKRGRITVVAWAPAFASPPDHGRKAIINNP